MKKTPWFPSTTKPVRSGWYEIDWPGDVYNMRYWCNGTWFTDQHMDTLSAFGNPVPGRWRGLAAPGGQR